ncbi:MAG: hypothetical protein LBG81_00060 [Coriobacteriaceae bacterium]|nr:hypothetical protein [Coriobacteriaceae bacterium]
MLISEGGHFTRVQKNSILVENMKRNKGTVRCDIDGKPLVVYRSQAGVIKPPNGAEIDHIVPRHQGGYNWFDNARVVNWQTNGARAAAGEPFPEPSTDFLRTKHRLGCSRKGLYQGCLHAMCVHLASSPRLAIIACETSWEHDRFSFQSRFYTDGTISFSRGNETLVGALRKNNSPRLSDYPEKDALDYLAQADKPIVQAAQEGIFPYLFLGFEEQEKRRLFGSKRNITAQPVVTTAFWSEGDELYSPDDEASFVAHGGEYIQELCLPKEELAELLYDDYDLEDDELAFAEGLFRLKLQGGTRLDAKALAPYAPYVGTEGYDYLLAALGDFGLTVMP